MKDNKLIAEFMGHKLGLDGDGMGEPQCRIFEKGLGTKRIEDTYSESWDWLIPVVAKCREQSNAEDNHWEAVYYSLEDCNIDVTYKAVVEFIKKQQNIMTQEELTKYALYILNESSTPVDEIEWLISNLNLEETIKDITKTL